MTTVRLVKASVRCTGHFDYKNCGCRSAQPRQVAGRDVNSCPVRIGAVAPTIR